MSRAFRSESLDSHVLARLHLISCCLDASRQLHIRPSKIDRSSVLTRLGQLTFQTCRHLPHTLMHARYRNLYRMSMKIVLENNNGLEGDSAPDTISLYLDTSTNAWLWVKSILAQKKVLDRRPSLRKQSGCLFSDTNDCHYIVVKGSFLGIILVHDLTPQASACRGSSDKR